MKLIPFILAFFVMTLVAQAQDYKVGLATENVNATTMRIIPQWTMPTADALYYNERFGTDELVRELQQIVNKIKARISNEQDNDLKRALRFLTPTEKQRILDTEELYRDTVGTFERSNPPTQGMLVAPYNGQYDETVADLVHRSGVGKAYSPRMEFLAGVGDSYNHGYPDSWGWIAFVLYEVPKYIVYTIVGYGVFLLGHYIAHEMFEWK